MVNDMKNIKCQDNDLWNLHVEGLKNFDLALIIRVNF